jgi:tetratricopeptide (TPR) repeat protein
MQPLPKVFKAPYRPNPNFTGRFDALESLHRALAANATVAVTAVSGLGGIGKTTLAAEYCHRFGGQYGGVWTVKAEELPVMLADLQELAGKLGVGSGQNTETDARAALDYLKSVAQPWLLVYDNVPNPDAVRDWLPIGAARTLITSRSTAFGNVAKVTPLDQWPEHVTAEYLLSRTGRDDAAGAARLAKDLGGLPLAAEQAAAFLETRAGISFDSYAKQIAALIKRPKPIGATGDYPDTVYAALIKSLETVGQAEGGETALDLLRLCAFLSPDGVDLALLMSEDSETILPPAFAATMSDEFAREDALAALASLSLLRREEGPAGAVLVFHRLLLDVMRDWMGEEARVLWGGMAVRLVDAVFPYNSDDDPAQWPLCARLMPHLAPLEAHAPRVGAAGVALDRLLNQAGGYLIGRGDREGALALIERSVILMRLTREEQPLVLAAGLCNLAVRLRYGGRLDEAEQAFREALEIEEAHLGPNDPSLAITLGNHAGVHMDREDFSQAERLLVRAAEIFKTAHGERSEQYAAALSNLGVIYGRWAEMPGQAARRSQAEKHTSDALTIRRVTRGERHPRTATGYANLGVISGKQYEWPAAAANMQRAMAIMLSLDLAQHPDAETRAFELAQVWEQSGHPEKAARLRNGDISDLLPTIAAVEVEHRAWVSADAANRHFGPPSFFVPRDAEQFKDLLASLIEAGFDADDLERRLRAGELSADDFAKRVADHLAHNAA